MKFRLLLKTFRLHRCQLRMPFSIPTVKSFDIPRWSVSSDVNNDFTGIPCTKGARASIPSRALRTSKLVLISVR